MARPLPPKDPKAVAQLVQLAKESRAELPGIVRRIETLVAKSDPIELLSQMTVLFQTHNSEEQPDREEGSRWQVRIEWLAWLIFSRGISAPPKPDVIDDPWLWALAELLDEYFTKVTMTLPEPVEGLTEEQDEMRSMLQLEALYVRGEGFHIHAEAMAVELYAPHDEWCLAHIGLTVDDALKIARAVPQLFEEKMNSMGAAQVRFQTEITADPTRALDLDLPLTFRDGLTKGGLPKEHLDEFARTVARVWFFSRAADMVGFTPDELYRKLDGHVGLERVEAFLRLLSTPSQGVQGEPDPLKLNPLAVTPLVEHGDRFYCFVPPLLIWGLYYAFHTRLYRDVAYRHTYDEKRAAWLERSAVEVFRKMLPKAEAGWGLTYGAKQHRTELDGLIRYDNKLILIECKWKSPTLLALSGDVVTALKDLEGAILRPLAQAKRARAYIEQHDQVEFIEATTGRQITVRRADITEVFLVTMVGSGAWAEIAANLPRLAPLGFFADGEYPWALSLNDLRVVSECLELPSQLFDFLRRRYWMQRDTRFRLHDEWDLLGVYLAGALDVDDPRFDKDLHYIALDGFDQPLQNYFYYLSNPLVPPVEKPRRQIPKNLRDLLVEVERARSPHKTDAICVALSWPDWGLEELSKGLEQARKKTVLDGRAHAIAVGHPWRSSGVTFACGYQNRAAIQDVLWRACETQREKTGAAEWVGFGIDLSAPWDPIAIYHNKDRDS